MRELTVIPYQGHRLDALFDEFVPYFEDPDSVHHGSRISSHQ